MSILISGGTGFVGLNLAEALLARGEHVVIAALDAPPPPAIAHFASLPGRLDTVIADVRDTEAFTALLRHHQVDRLFPFAAITSGPAREAEFPEQIVATNLVGFIGQLRAARDAGVRRVVIPSSSSVYGESYYQHALMDEATTPCVPIALYAVTKYAVERAGLRLAGLWGMDVVAARIGALFGPWERDTGLRDTISPYWHAARLAASGQPIVIPATLPTGAFVYARDAASGLLHLLDLPNPPYPVFNICSGTEWRPMLPAWCAKLAQSPGATWHQSQDQAACTVRPTDPRDRGRMSIARIQATGWSPGFTPEAALTDYQTWLTHPGHPQL